MRAKFNTFFRKMEDTTKATNENTAEEVNATSEQNQAIDDATSNAEQLQDLPLHDNSEVAKLEEQLTELNEKYLRLFSDFDNYRKRTAKERIELAKTAGEDIFKSVLPILDDFERAAKALNESSDLNALKEGVDLIQNKLVNILQSKGLEPMLTVGETFDVDVHEAITNIPAPSEELKGKVVEEVERGYTLNGKVIRYAKVLVGN